MSQVTGNGKWLLIPPVRLLAHAFSRYLPLPEWVW